ncbi:MAG: hypothetical protein ACKPHU_30275, partial [Planctomycetaceae bacterium]
AENFAARGWLFAVQFQPHLRIGDGSLEDWGLWVLWRVLVWRCRLWSPGVHIDPGAVNVVIFQLRRGVRQVLRGRKGD